MVEDHFDAPEAGLWLLGGLGEHAVPAYPEVLRVGALDHGGDGDDGVHHHQEGGHDDPVELVEERQVRPPVPHQTLVRVQDHEGAEDEAGKKGAGCN